jgi:hypothetical protein
VHVLGGFPCAESRVVYVVARKAKGFWASLPVLREVEGALRPTTFHAGLRLRRYA